MGVVSGCVTPHPPIVVEEVGGASTTEVQSTIDAMRRLAHLIAADEPEALVIVSPHSPQIAGGLPVRVDPVLEGSFASFRAPQVRFQVRTDVELAEAIVAEAQAEDLPVGAVSAKSGLPMYGMYGEELDHGVMVPLYFLGRAVAVPVVNLGLAFLPYEIHYRIGQAVQKAAQAVARRVTFVASGDLSHRLIPGAPAGYNPRGAELDRAIEVRLRKQDFEGLRHLDAGLIEAGGECGLRSIITLTGCFADRKARFEVLSYEGPFGVGYLVGYMTQEGAENE